MSFSLPEKHHKRMREGLEVVVSVYFCVRIQSDTAKHLQEYNEC